MTSSVDIADDNLYEQLEKALRAEKSSRQALLQLVAQAPFAHDRDMALLFLGFISFFILDDKGTSVMPGGVTDNDYYLQSVANYKFEFAEYKVPMSATGNSIVQAITSGKPTVVTSWESIRRPKVEEGYAGLNQASSGIGCSIIYPLTGKLKGALMYNFFQYPESIGEPQELFMKRYTGIVSGVLAHFKGPDKLAAAV